MSSIVLQDTARKIFKIQHFNAGITAWTRVSYSRLKAPMLLAISTQSHPFKTRLFRRYRHVILTLSMHLVTTATRARHVNVFNRATKEQ
jgi:hypothetical protein